MNKSQFLCAEHYVSEVINSCKTGMENDTYPLDALHKLAVIGIAALKNKVSENGSDNAVFTTLSGVELDMTSADAGYLMRCHYPFSTDSNLNITFYEQTAINRLTNQS